MSKKMNKTLIGAFVIGAIGLLVIAVLIFGSGKFFADTAKYVLFFDGSVKGLNIGSPVMYHGVKIGEVTEIQLRFNPKDLSAVIPVYVEIDPKKFVLPEGFHRELKKYEFAKPLIEKGFKGQLQTQSFVTGQLMIGVDFYPDKSIRLVGIEKKYPEIPTVPTPLEELTKTIQVLPLKEIVTKLELAIDGIQKLVNSPKTRESVESLNHILKDTQKLVQHIDEKIGPLMASLTKTSDVAQETLSETKNSMSILRGEAKETLEAARDTLKQTEKTLSSLRLLSDYLERNPEALLRGKPKQEGVSK